MKKQMVIEDDQKADMFKKDATRMYVLTGVAVLLVVLCGCGIGIGVGYGIWNVGSAEAPSPKPAEHWIDTPCVTGSEPVCPPGVDRPPFILVSLDGFRADYLNREFTAHIKRLSDCGTHAPYMLPSFPSVTFSNHYTIVTGLYPEHHGLIANSMYDPVMKKNYYIGGSQTQNNKWYDGEPIWNTAKKNSLRTGCYFWVGSDVDIQDMRPDYYFLYTGGNTPEQKIDTIRGWMQLPTGKRPDFITLYFDEPDHEGHDFGPYSDEVDRKLEVVDKYIEDLMDALVVTKMHQCVNIMILADHGMANRSCDRYIKLGDKNGINFPSSQYYSRSTAGCMMRYSPDPDKAVLTEPRDIVDRLKCRDPNVIPYVKEDMPKRWHYMNSQRIENVLVPVKEDYAVTNVGLPSNCDGGGHGYDNLAIQMQALFLAYGPAFKKNLKIEPFQNIELFNVMCDVLGIPAPANDGEDGRLHEILQNPPSLPPINKSNYATPLACPYPGSDQEYTERLAADESMCKCDDKLANFTSHTVKYFDEQLKISDSAAAKMKHALFGVPKVTFKTDFCELVQKDYITAYSHELKMPLYTSFTIDKKASRDRSPGLKCARPDVRVPVSATPNCTNYNIPAMEPNVTVDFDLTNMTMGFSYSPGLTETLESRMDTLVTSNLVPQFSGFIKDVWSGYLDEYLPKWADAYNGINVVTGPIFDYDLDGLRDPMDVLTEKGEKLEDTVIPTHYFAVITRCSDDADQPISKDCSPLTPLAFILHNKDGIQACQGQIDYMETNTARVKDVELLTGLRFYPDLERYQAIHLRTYNVQRDHFFKYWDKN